MIVLRFYPINSPVLRDGLRYGVYKQGTHGGARWWSTMGSSPEFVACHCSGTENVMVCNSIRESSFWEVVDSTLRLLIP